MFEFMKKLMLARLIQFEKGQILLMGLPVAIIPMSILCDLQKQTIESLGYEKAYEKLYEGAKRGSKIYNERFIKKYGLRKLNETLDNQAKIVTSAGWGEVIFTKINAEEKTAILKFVNSPYAITYGKSNKPACIIQAGFVAGGVSITFNTDMDVFETKCVSNEDSFCEMLIGPAEIIKEKKRLKK